MAGAFARFDGWRCGVGVSRYATVSASYLIIIILATDFKLTTMTTILECGDLHGMTAKDWFFKKINPDKTQPESK